LRCSPRRTPRYGIGNATLDGVPFTIDSHGGTAYVQREVWSSRTLSPGAHTLTIEWGAAKNMASRGYVIDVHAMEVLDMTY
jgi:hypothetical protein